MNRNYGIVVLSTPFLVISIFTFSKQVEVKGTQESKSRLASTPNESIATERSYYSHLFHHIVFLNRKADEQEQSGKDGEPLRTLYRRQIGLSEKQSRALYEISLDCVNAVAQQDKKAKQIIDQLRAQYPSGKIEQGEKLRPPPAELQAMQEERNQIILAARNRLRSALGEENFSRLDAFVKTSVTLDTRQIAKTMP